jgi:hypothetical protein
VVAAAVDDFELEAEVVPVWAFVLVSVAGEVEDVLGPDVLWCD